LHQNGPHGTSALDREVFLSEIPLPQAPKG
jgi:hypothetical protein